MVPDPDPQHWEKQCLFTLLGPFGYPRLGIFVTKRQWGKKLYKKCKHGNFRLFYIRYFTVMSNGKNEGPIVVSIDHVFVNNFTNFIFLRNLAL
jgi:hypothetical protein